MIPCFLVMGICRIDFNNINLSGINYAEDDPETVINIKFLACYSKFKKHKAPEKRVQWRINGYY